MTSARHIPPGDMDRLLDHTAAELTQTLLRLTVILEARDEQRAGTLTHQRAKQLTRYYQAAGGRTHDLPPPAKARRGSEPVDGGKPLPEGNQ